MTITLPDEMREILEARAKSGGFDCVDEYVEDVVSSEQLSVDFGDPSAQARLKELVDQALTSGPATPITAEFWDRLNTKVAERLAQVNDR